MSALTAWPTDDYGLSSGAQLQAHIQADGPPIRECGCGWAAISKAGGDW
jgi:hypothetical protein